MMTLPKISLKKLAATSTMKEERDRLKAACEAYGFFNVVEHDIPRHLIAGAIDSSRGFFALPQHVKQQCGHAAQRVFPNTSRGYSPLYGEILHPDAGADPKEVFDLGIERSGDTRPFAGLTRFPGEDVAPGFKRSLLDLQSAVLNNVIPILGRSLADILEFDDGWYEQHFTTPTILQRVIRYPAGAGRAGKHTDNGFFTVLMQEELPTPSLKVAINGQWTPIPSLSGGFVVNLGDMLQALSDGVFKSTPHFVEHSGLSDRISLPFFVYPDIESCLISKSSKQRFNVSDVMLTNFKSIWETAGGAGRAKELQ